MSYLENVKGDLFSSGLNFFSKSQNESFGLSDSLRMEIVFPVFLIFSGTTSRLFSVHKSSKSIIKRGFESSLAKSILQTVSQIVRLLTDISHKKSPQKHA